MTFVSGIGEGDIYLYEGDERVGDAEVLTGRQRGTSNNFYGEDSVAGYIGIGDAYDMSGKSRGGNDVFHAGSYVGYAGDISSGIGGAEIGTSSIFLDLITSIPAATFAGDAISMSGSARGGNDEMWGGDNSLNIFAGDALDVMSGTSQGGNDALYGGRSQGDGYAINLLMGDGYVFGMDESSGVRAASGQDSDAAVAPVKVTGGSDVLVGGEAYAVDGGLSVNINVLVGDAYAITGRSVGGIDTLTGGDAYAVSGTAVAVNVMTGDALFMEGRVVAAADTLHGGDAYSLGAQAFAVNIISGDSYALGNGARAGNDKIYGGDAGYPDGELGPFTSLDIGGSNGVLNLLTGDGFMVDGSGARLGNDLLVGGNGNWAWDGYAINALVGDIADVSGLLGGLPVDPQAMSSTAVGDFISVLGNLGTSDIGAPMAFGNDELIGGEEGAQNYLVGDTTYMYSGGVGGKDVLRGGGWSTENYLIGDALYMDEGAQGGADKLISGEGNDQMWGDAMYMMGQGGADRFVFSMNNGEDVVMDFRVLDKDVIDLTAFRGEEDFANFKAFMASGRAEQTGDGVLLHLNDYWSEVSIDVPPSGTVLLVGVNLDDLSGRSFAF